MSIETRTEWMEPRFVEEGQYETYFVIAEKHDGAWRFFERSTWSVGWLECSSTPELVERAERAVAKPVLTSREDERRTQQPAHVRSVTCESRALFPVWRLSDTAPSLLELAGNHYTRVRASRRFMALRECTDAHLCAMRVAAPPYCERRERAPPFPLAC